MDATCTSCSHSQTQGTASTSRWLGGPWHSQGTRMQLVLHTQEQMLSWKKSTEMIVQSALTLAAADILPALHSLHSMLAL